MIELVLTINDKDGSYTKHAAVVLASIFSNTQERINVHIVHDNTLTDENKSKLSQLVDIFHHNIFYYHVSVPGDLTEVASGVHKIDYWTIASMYRLLLPLFLQTDRVIYLDCDILVNMDINELWSVDLGDRYLGAVLDQGQNLLEYFNSLGLNAETYFNSGVILFHLDNIRNKHNWYEEMLNFLRAHPMMTMPDQDVLNSVYGANYLQMDQRFNTFAHAELDLENKIVHFAGDNKWWDSDSPAAPLYARFLAMTPWAGDCTPEHVHHQEHVHISPAPEHVQIQPEPPAPEPQPVSIQLPENPVQEVIAPAPEILCPKPRRKRRRSKRLRLRRKLRLRLRLKLKKKKLIRAKYRSKKRIKLIKRLRVKRKKALLLRKKKRQLVKKVRKHLKRKTSHRRRKAHLKRTS